MAQLFSLGCKRSLWYFRLSGTKVFGLHDALRAIAALKFEPAFCVDVSASGIPFVADFYFVFLHILCQFTFCSLTSRRSQPPLALSVPLSRFTSQVGGGSAFFVRRIRTVLILCDHYAASIAQAVRYILRCAHCIRLVQAGGLFQAWLD